jgi:hypothetical protein
MSLLIAQDVVDDPFPLWRRYAQKYTRTIREYDHGGSGDPDILTEAEAWRSRIINSRLTRGECTEVVRRAQSAPWASVPATADLADADASVAGGLFADTAGLYWWFTSPARIKGVAVAKVHKILHLKRPGLYPILDEQVKSLYRPSAATWVSRLGHLGGLRIADSPPYWAAFRSDLVKNLDQLQACRTRMADDDDEAVRLMGTLTCLRLQDMIAWMIAAGHTQV